MFRGSVLLVALLCSAPSVWAAFGAQTVPVEAALIHFLIAVPIVAVLLGLVRSAMGSRPGERSDKPASPPV